METQPISPYGGSDHVEESPKKKSVIGKVKDKAKKLKTKVKKPKSPGAADKNDTSSSSEEESGSDPSPQSGPGEEREVAATPGAGLKGDAYEAIPDPHASDKPAPTGGVERGLEQLSLNEPGAPGAGFPVDEGKIAGGPVDVGKSAFPVDEGKNVEGKDLLVTPTSTDPQDTTPEGHAGEDAAIGAAAAAAAAAGTGALAGKSQSESNIEGEKKSMLEQAKERIFGSSKKAEGEPLPTGESQTPTITERATNTATGLKDTIAAKLGYGSSNQVLTSESGENVPPADPQDPANKSTVQKIQEGAAGATAAVTSKLGYGEKPATGEGVESGVGAGDNKTYTERASEAAYGAKDAVAAKLGYGGTGSTDTPTAEGDQKSYATKIQESAVGAKDAVAAKLGYGGDDPNAPASTAERFHPGEEDRALSQLITEKMSTGATTVKDTLMRPFAGKSGPPTPTTTPPPSTAQAVAADPLHNVVPDTPPPAGKEEPGIVGKVTGAVTSLLGTSGSGKKRDVDEPASKASEDTQAAAEVH